MFLLGTLPTRCGGNSAIESAAFLAKSPSALAHGSPEAAIGKTSAGVVAAAKLDCDPLPPKSLQCSMPYNYAESHARDGQDHVWSRALPIAPLLGCYSAAQATMGTLLTHLNPLIAGFFAQGAWSASNGEVLRLHRPIYHITLLDNLFRPLITCVLPSISGSDPHSRIQMLSFMTDLGPLDGIWLLESYHQAHSWREVLLCVDITAPSWLYWRPQVTDTRPTPAR
ncbi:hypothetical protein ABOM_003971 [Aspergillus bombycis]|uniref:Uncharacterized protein n=1 Tax=Aspergillus bombycis TaxID=109264 RepID=A0A1F8A603_9EURO|nr:hypothetical protein ABOM_003971 [Aspergillus bombycis]OGM47172.1 hypothetical protein ABOM_003971 [Aspergillus bombycis]